MEPKNELMQEEFLQNQEEGEIEEEEEYKIWKKNAPYLYDVLITWGLDWPSLCVNWTSKVEYLKQSSYYKQKIIFGTHTNGQETDYLIIANTNLPISQFTLEKNPPEKYLDKKDLDYLKSIKNEEMIENYAKYEKKIEVEIKIPHEGEVNKAKASPHENNIIATQTNKGEIHIFNYLVVINRF